MQNRIADDVTIVEAATKITTRAVQGFTKALADAAAPLFAADICPDVARREYELALYRNDTVIDYAASIYQSALEHWPEYLFGAKPKKN